MTKIAPLLCCFYVLVLSCVNVLAQNKTVIIFNAKSPDSVKTRLWFNHLIPANTVMDTSMVVHGNSVLHVDVDRPTLADVSFNAGKHWPIYLYPADTMRLSLVNSASGYEPDCAGLQAGISKYFLNKRREIGFDYASSKTYMISHELPARMVFATIDSFALAELEFLDRYKESLPGAFYTKERELIQLTALNGKLILGSKQYIPFADLVALDSAFKTPLQVSPANTLEFAAMMYLASYYMKRYADTIKGSYTDKYRVTLAAMRQDGVPREFLEVYHSYWLSFMIPNIVNVEMLGQYQQLWNELRPDFTFVAGKRLLDSLLVKRGNELFADDMLKPGMPAPVISFTDASGKQVSLADFKGKWVYLDYWATWCIPCRHDLGIKKELGFDSISKELVILNICVRSKRQDWLDYLKMHHPTGVNWYADELQGEKVAKLYNALGVPHYVLIRPDGSVYQNGAAHPAEIVDSLRSLTGPVIRSAM